MTVVTRFLIAILTAAMLASCATPDKVSDPRTMSFPPLKFEIPESEGRSCRTAWWSTCSRITSCRW